MEVNGAVVWALVEAHWLEGLVALLAIALLRLVIPSLFAPAVPSLKLELPSEARQGWRSEPVTVHAPQDPSRPGMIQCYDPATGYRLGYIKAMTRDDVAAVIARARAAQAAWGATTFQQRRAVLRVLMKYVLDNQEAIARIAARDSGKTVVDASFGEILTTLEKLRWTIQRGEAVLQPEYRDTNMLMVHRLARIQYEPLGVVGAIVSWNYPFHNLISPVISAIFAGNACIVKVSEHTSWSSRFFSDMIRAALQACGHSADVFQPVFGFAEAGDALVKGGIDKITFIGSPAVGKRVMAAASEHLVPTVLELGGKDPAIICEDCDFGQVVNLTLRGTFQNCGQNCIGLERMIVHTAIYDRFVEAIHRQVKTLRQGAPLEELVDQGSIRLATELDRLEALVNDAVTKGARLLAGGARATVPNWPNGQFFQPTLLVDVTPAMRIAQEEVFGPIFVVLRAQDDADAVRIANDCPYGLGSSVFSRDTKRAERIMAQLRVGMSNMNDFAVNYLVQSMPFGGFKISGFDRIGGVEGLRGNCLAKSVTVDRFPGVRTNLPPLLQYPLSSASFKFTEALCAAFYGMSITAKLNGLVSLALLALKPKGK